MLLVFGVLIAAVCHMYVLLRLKCARQRRQESGDSSDSSTRNNSKSRLPQYDINHNWQKIPKPYEGDATGTAQE